MVMPFSSPLLKPSPPVGEGASGGLLRRCSTPTKPLPIEGEGFQRCHSGIISESSAECGIYETLHRQGAKTMTILRAKTLLVVMTLLLAAGCVTKPIMNVENRPIPMTAQPLTLAQIEALIMTAGQQRGWQFSRVSAGHLTATQAVPRHSAVVDIRFDQKAYTITHKTSVNLKEKDGMIHTR